ncbi:hypothetical protein N9H84_03760 [Candidatus Pelagibacter sp.]|nr:hypothetical protein [Candidatus Pelagibacter sp.]
MHNKKITVKEVKKDFESTIGSRSRELKFLKKYSESKIYVSKTTGTVYHSPTVSSLEEVSKFCSNK